MTREEFKSNLINKLYAMELDDVKAYAKEHGIRLYSRGRSEIIAYIANVITLHEFYGDAFRDKNIKTSSTMTITFDVVVPEAMRDKNISEILRVVVADRCHVMNVKCGSYDSDEYEDIPLRDIVYKEGGVSNGRDEQWSITQIDG